MRVVRRVSGREARASNAGARRDSSGIRTANEAAVPNYTARNGQRWRPGIENFPSSVVAGLSARNETAPIVTDAKGHPLPDTDARDTENVPLSEDIHTYFEREVLPHVPDAWIDESKTKIGYEIPFTRHFHKYVPPRLLDEIDADLNKLVREITELLNEVEA